MRLSLLTTTERFVVMEVWCDGNPVDVARKESLEDALDLRDTLRLERPGRRGTGPLFYVVDADDPERGWLDHDDVYEYGSR